MQRHAKATPLVLLIVALAAGQAQALTTLFADNFNRVDDRDIDATTTGVTNNTGTAFGASAVYTQPFLDPNNAEPTFGVQDGDATNGGGAQVIGNQLQLAVGAGTSNAFINHNFTNNVILSDGGFKVSLDVLGYAGNGRGQGGAFAIGMTQAEAAGAGDAFRGHPIGSTAPGNKMQSAFEDVATVEGTVVSDFWVGLTGTGTLYWGGAGAENIFGTAAVGSKTGNISAAFSAPSFTAGETVTYEVFFNNLSQGLGTFTWSDTNANYIGLDARDGTSVTLDNFVVETILPPPKPTLTVDRNTGEIKLTNLTSSPLSISAYSIITEDGGFDQTNWNKIEGRDANDTWITFTAPDSTTDLAEGTLGEYTIAAANAGMTDELSFGNAWRRSPYEDLAFELRDANGNEVPTLVEFVGNGGNSYQEGDFSLNGALDAADWAILKAGLSSDVSALAPLDRYFAGDLNNDGFVNQTDFREFKGFFPASGPNSFAAIAGVPEPATAMLAVIAGALFAVRRVRRTQWAAGLLAVLAVCGTTLVNRAGAADLFVDSFDRPDNMNIDAVKTGISGTAGAALPADGVYTSPFLDPAAESGGPDADALNGGGHDISGNQLRLAVGAGTSNAFVNHNFTDAAIASAKGFRVTLDVTGYAGTALGQGGAFAVGMSQAEALTAGDAQAAAPNNSFTHAFGGTPNVLGDFWLGLRGDSNLAWGAGNVAPTLSGVAAKTGTISAEFVAHDFNAGSTVAYQVFYNGVAQGHGVFKWSGTNENFIGLDARDGTAVTLDNFKIESVAGLTPQTLRLQVNTTTGAASIVGGGSSNSLDFYEITSAAGGLLAGGFNGIRGDGGLPAGDGSGNGWELGGSNSANSLTEAYLLDESTIAAGSGALPLGAIWNTGANQRDLSFTYYDDAGVAQMGFVEYVASSGGLPDFNADSKVDGGDFLIWQRNFGTGTSFAQGDANGNGAVDGADLALWDSSYGASATVPAVGAVPEPAAAALCLAACGAVGFRSRMRRR